MSYNEMVKAILIFVAGIIAGLLVASLFDELSKVILIFVAGIIAGVIPRMIYDWVNRPQVFINGIDVTSPQVFINGIDVAGSCHSIFVENKGRSAAIKCEAMLTLPNIDPKEDIIDIKSATLTTKSFREIKDMNLSWARRANGTSCSIAVTIYSGACQLLNFCKIEKLDPKDPHLAIIIASENGFDSPRVLLKSHKKYEGEIKIFAENVKYDSKKHKKKFIISKDHGGNVEFKFI